MMIVYVLLFGTALVTGTQIRLSSYGIVEVYHLNRWGRICNVGWDNKDAIVVCKMLGYPLGGKTRSTGYYYGRYGYTWLSNVNCNSTETDIADCGHSGWGNHQCFYQRQSARVECFKPVNGGWNNWNYWSSCPVTCGIGHRYRYRSCNRPRPKYGGTQCVGNNTQVLSCYPGVKCPETYDIRLKQRYGGYGGYQGRVEVYYRNNSSLFGFWGTVCDDSFGKPEADVICRTLGYRFGGIPRIGSYFGAGHGPILIDELQCNGTEDGIANCTHSEWKVHNCDHTEDASVTCYTGEWSQWSRCSTTCGAGIRLRQLECHAICTFAVDTGKCILSPCAVDGIWTPWEEWSKCSVTCENGRKTRRRECSNPKPEHGGKPCDGSEVEYLPCEMGNNCPVEVRLAGSYLENQGRVEVYYNRSWGTICDDDWDSDDATVVCKMLNSSYEGTAVSRLRFGEGRGRIWMDNVKCSSEELNISDCHHNGWGANNCRHNEDAGVLCYLNEREEGVRVRLVGSNFVNRGRVELHFMNEWGTICDNGWEDIDAGVICRMLGYQNGGIAYGNSKFGVGKGSIWLDSVSCKQEDHNITECQHPRWGEISCTHLHDAGVLCLTSEMMSDVEVRLVGGDQPDKGRVEVLVEGEWGTICNAEWEQSDTNTVCGMLGYPYHGLLINGSVFGQGTGRIWNVNASCYDRNSTMPNFSISAYGIAECLHTQDVGVWCTSMRDATAQIKFRLVGGEEPHRGRLEVLFMDEWGTVCDNALNGDIAGIVCGMLGYGSEGFAFKGSIFGQGNGTIWLDKLSCSANETSLTDCSPSIWGYTFCSHHQDISVWCTSKVDAEKDIGIRLAGSDYSDRGRVEVKFMNKWGTICDNGFDEDDANFFCRILGYENGGIAVPSTEYRQEDGIIWIDNVECDGDSMNITDCYHGGWSNHTCDHSQDASVICVSKAGKVCSPWGNWSECMVTCGNGTITRVRKCKVPESDTINHVFSKYVTDIEECSTGIPCPTDGEWGNWTEWSRCSATCEKGVRTRSRKCINPTADFGGKWCIGNADEAEECNTDKRCPIDGKLSDWTSWTSCSVTCGNGTKSRTRDCNSPHPLFGGVDCVGQRFEEKNCETSMQCPVDGQWSYWTEWSSCSDTCEKGIRRRSRECNNPAVEYGGRLCVGNDEEAEECNTGLRCPIDGQWSVWGTWSNCDTTCGNGTLLRTRSCTNPVPYFGGKYCQGLGEESKECTNKVNCPVNGGWSVWNVWSSCLVTCGNGSIVRSRNCDNPRPMYNGKHCNGTETDWKTCDTEIQCPVNGNWGTWTNWTVCSATCSNGTKSRTRRCDNPAPQYDGNRCVGTALDVVSCNATLECPVDGQWGSWSVWSDCSATCGCGNAQRTRVCDNPDPLNGDRKCNGTNEDRKECFIDKICHDFCGEGHFLCMDHKTCVTTIMSCDGIEQCPDGDDEINCLDILSGFQLYGVQSSGTSNGSERRIIDVMFVFILYILTTVT